jgi:hypothetical protein
MVDALLPLVTCDSLLYPRQSSLNLMAVLSIALPSFAILTDR